MMYQMNKEWKDKWVEALRSGGYEQGRNQLRDGKNYCCLGVLTDIVTHFDGIEPTNGDLPLSVVNAVELAAVTENKWVMIPSDPDVNGLALSYWNDQKRCTFNQIADLIEEHIEGV